MFWDWKIILRQETTLPIHFGTLMTIVLIHLPLMPHICVGDLGQRWFRQWFVACSAPSHCLSQCWLIVNWAFRNQMHSNSNGNTKLFIRENAFESVVWEISAIFMGVGLNDSDAHKGMSKAFCSFVDPSVNRYSKQHIANQRPIDKLKSLAINWLLSVLK